MFQEIQRLRAIPIGDDRLDALPLKMTQQHGNAGITPCDQKPFTELFFVILEKLKVYFP